jgi:hypothetical protein
MTWDELKKRYERVPVETLLLVENLLEFIDDRKKKKLQGKIEFVADNNGVTDKGDRLERFTV